MSESTAFAYWQQADRAPLSAFTAFWTGLIPSFATYGDDEVLPILESLFPSAVEMYLSIAIPAARSDIARLLLLHAHGGMFVGSHLGVDDFGPLEATLDLLNTCDGVLVERTRNPTDSPEMPRIFINGLLVARSGSSWLLDVCARALENLCAQQLAERSGHPAPYDVWSLTGPGLLTEVVANWDPAALRAEYDDRLMVRTEPELRIQREQFPHRTKPGQHWSERQRTEPLFVAH